MAIDPMTLGALGVAAYLATRGGAVSGGDLTLEPGKRYEVRTVVQDPGVRDLMTIQTIPGMNLSQQWGVTPTLRQLRFEDDGTWVLWAEFVATAAATVQVPASVQVKVL